MQSCLTLKAHFDGTQVVMDEPFSLEPDSKLLVTVLPRETDADRDDWLRFSTSHLVSAYSQDEPEYSPRDLKEINPEYEGR